MRRSALIVSLLSLTSFLSASADDVSPPISMLKIVLEPSGETEIAPHQQGNVYAPDVIREGKNLRMWYGGQGRDGHDRIATAVSQDGLNWVRQGIAIQNERANHVNDPSVVVVNGKYYMYYTRTEKDVVDRIDLAISDDGTHWTTRGAVIVPENPTDWDGLSVGRPSVIFDGQQFHLWYDGRKDFPPNAPVKDVPKSPSSHRSVGYATSADGMTWIKSASNPVFEHDAGAVDVKQFDGRFLMLYESGEGTLFATSPNGIDWRSGGLFLKKSGTQIDAFGHVTPFLLNDPATRQIRLFVGAATAQTWDHNRIALSEVDPRLLRQILTGQ